MLCEKIKKRRIAKNTKKQLPDSISALQQSYLLGSLLGDGCLFKYKPTHQPYFAVQRKLSDIQYCEWERMVMEPFVCKWYRGKTFDKRTNKIYEWIKFRSHRCELFNCLYEAWYPNGVKIVPQTINFDSISMAVWFADDGYVREIGVGKLQLKLSTHGFDLESVEFLCELLSKRYGGYFGITLETSESGIKPIIYASSDSSWNFIEDIDSVVEDCGMNRKIVWRGLQKKIQTEDHFFARKIHNGKRL